MKRDLNIDVPIARCYKAKKEALHQLFGSHSKQYHLIRRYTSAVLNANPGSSVNIQRDGAFFQRMYICLDACKNGFKYGCWPIICLNACHLKGGYGGQLLCAIGKDDNDDMFPIGYEPTLSRCCAKLLFVVAQVVPIVYVECVSQGQSYK